MTETISGLRSHDEWAAIAKTASIAIRAYIGDRFAGVGEDDGFNYISPATGGASARAAACSTCDVGRAVKRARRSCSDGSGRMKQAGDGGELSLYEFYAFEACCTRGQTGSHFRSPRHDRD